MKLFTKLLTFWAFLFSITMVPFAQTGPAGVGSQATNTNWHDANSLGLSNGTAVTNFSDKSGNGNDFIQNTTTKKPLFTSSAINGLPALTFDGSNDFMSTGSDSDLESSNLTYFVVYDKSPLKSQSLISADYSSQARKWASYCNSNNEWIYNVQYSPSLKWSRYLDLNTYTFMSYHIQPTQQRAYRQGVAANLRLEAYTTPTGHQKTTIGRFSNALNDLSCLNGAIAEVIIFNSNLNELERLMIENYLGAKYGMSIPTDRYAYEGTHNLGLIGIGNDGSNSQTTAQGSGILELSNATSLGSGDYLLAANDGVSLTSFTTTDLPGTHPTHKRFTRTWRVDETNEVGTVDIKFYLSGGNNFGASSSYTLFVDETTQDGNFTDATPYSGTYNAGEQSITFSVTLNDGDILTLAGIEQMLDIVSDVASGDWSNPNSWDCTCTPTSNDNVTILSGHNISVDVDAEAMNLTVEGTLTMNQNFSLNIYEFLDITGSAALTDGTIAFIGSIGQTMDVNGASLEFNNITIDNSGFSDVTFNEGTYILNGTLSPESGGLVLENVNTDFIVNSTSSTAGGRIGPIADGFNLSGDFTVRRFIPSGSAGWRDLSSPIANGNLSMWDADLALSGEGFPDGCAYGVGGCFYSVQEFYSYSYHDVTDPNLSLVPGKGYEIYMGDDTITFSGVTVNVKGQINAGDVSKSFSTGWNIHGNPFTSSVLWGGLDRGQVDNYFYVLDVAAGDWQWYDGSNNTSSTPELANGIIAPGQGYWAYDWGTMVYEQSDKTTSTGTYIRNDVQEDHSLKLQLSENGTTYYTIIALEESEIALDEFDTIQDIRHLTTSIKKAPTAAFYFDEELVRKNWFKKDFRDKSFDLYTEFFNVGEYTFTAYNMEAFDSYSKIILYDKVTGELIDLRKEINYVFHSEVENSARFTIILSNENDIEESAIETANTIDLEQGLEIIQMGSVININAEENIENIQITLYNTLGQVVHVFNNTNLLQGSNVINVPSGTSGVRILSINNNGKLITKKLVF